MLNLLLVLALASAPVSAPPHDVTSTQGQLPPALAICPNREGLTAAYAAFVDLSSAPEAISEDLRRQVVAASKLLEHETQTCFDAQISHGKSDAPSWRATGWAMYLHAESLLGDTADADAEKAQKLVVLSYATFALVAGTWADVDSHLADLAAAKAEQLADMYAKEYNRDLEVDANAITK